MKTIESLIQEKGLNAPRITPKHIEDVIASEHYFTAKEGVLGSYKSNNDVYVGDAISHSNATSLSLLTLCVLVLENGFTVTGESACASPDNFDSEIGRKIARENAVSKIWVLEGYKLKSSLSS
jgi:hypothetical protein